MMLEHLDSAIRELNEAKRLAQLFGWPESVVKRIDLVRRGAIYYRKQIEQEMTVKTIWKFDFDVSDSTQLRDMPDASQVLSVQVQSGKICLWASVFPDNQLRTRAFRVRGTGHEWGVGEEWVGTVQMPPFVWHLLEVVPPMGGIRRLEH